MEFVTKNIFSLFLLQQNEFLDYLVQFENACKTFCPFLSKSVNREEFRALVQAELSNFHSFLKTQT